MIQTCGAFDTRTELSYPGDDGQQQKGLAAGAGVQGCLAAKDFLRAVGRILVQERPLNPVELRVHARHLMDPYKIRPT